MNTFGVAIVRTKVRVCYSVGVRFSSLWSTSALVVFFWSRLTLSCEVCVTGQSWPQRLLVPQNSTITLNCTTNLPSPYWSIRLPGEEFMSDFLFTDVGDNRMILHENGVYQLNIISGTLWLKVNQTADNNQTVIRCLSRSAIILETTLFVYEPILLILEETGDNMLKSAYISWNSLPLFGGADINQTFELTVVGTNTREKTYHEIREPNFVFQAPKGAPQCEVYNFTVTGAYVGASYTGTDCSLPSPVLSTMLPSLPNVSRTESSLDYMLEKNSIINYFVLRVSFVPATYCDRYPITSYTLEVQGTDMIHKSQTSLTSTSNISVDNLVDNNVYNFSIIVSNDAGNSSTSRTTFYTTDVQVVRAVQLEDDSTLMLQCLFVNGSDAIGCLVVLQLIGEADTTTVKLVKEDIHMYAMKVVKLMKSTACISEIFGYDIESNGSVGTLTIPGELFRNVSLLLNCDSSGEVTEDNPITQIIIIIVAAVLFLIIIIIFTPVLFTLFCFGLTRSRVRAYRHEDKPSFSELEQNVELYDSPTQKHNGAGRTPGDGAADCNYYSITQHKHESPCPDVSNSNAGYAELVDAEEHFYHELECNRIPRGVDSEVILPDPDAPELPPPFKEESLVPPPIYHDISDLPGRGTALRQNDYTDTTLTK